MHEHTNFKVRLFYEFQDIFHQKNCLIFFVCQMNLTPLRMNNIGEHGSGKIQAKHMNFNFKGNINKLQHPIYQIIIQICADDPFLHRAFLKNGKAESLGYVPIVLLIQDLYYFLNYDIIAIIGYVLDSFDCRHYHTDQGSNGMSQ